MTQRPPAILVTGASGYVGRLLAAALLEREPRALVLAPVRKKHDHNRLREAFTAELMTTDPEARARMLERLVFLPMPPTAQLATELVPHMLRELAGYDVTDIVHSAGCLSYFNAAKLHEGNEVLTSVMLELARALSVEKFVYVSSAFTSGYVDGVIPEALHPEPDRDPNEYTKSKRKTEWIVARSGIPFQIHRPSGVVGSSIDGRYSGKPYGGYQMWTGLCRFLCDRPREAIHMVAPDVALNLVHQDAVQAGFHAALRQLPPGAIVNLVSRPATAPTTRDFWHIWMERCGRPEAVYYYDQLEDLERDALDERERLLVDFAECNIEISSHVWDFETTALDGLKRAGLAYQDATRATISVIFDWFLERNHHAQNFLAAHGAALSGRRTRMIPVPRGTRPQPRAAAAGKQDPEPCTENSEDPAERDDAARAGRAFEGVGPVAGYAAAGAVR